MDGLTSGRTDRTNGRTDGRTDGRRTDDGAGVGMLKCAVLFRIRRRSQGEPSMAARARAAPCGRQQQTQAVQRLGRCCNIRREVVTTPRA
eukprot:4955269-Prymnesium_polylepis.1